MCIFAQYPRGVVCAESPQVGRLRELKHVFDQIVKRLQQPLIVGQGQAHRGAQGLPFRYAFPDQQAAWISSRVWLLRSDPAPHAADLGRHGHQF